MNVNKSLKKQLIKARRNIRRKLELIKSGEIEKEINLEKSYIPITKQLTEISKNLQNIPRKKINMLDVKEEEQEEEEEEEKKKENKEKRQKIKKENENRKNVLNPYYTRMQASQNLKSDFDIDVTLEKYVNDVKKNSKDIDDIYGVTYNKICKIFMMANKEIKFIEQNIIVNQEKF